MLRLIRPDLVWFVEVQGGPAAVGVCLLNLNEAIRDLGGKLFPIGWLPYETYRVYQKDLS